MFVWHIIKLMVVCIFSICLSIFGGSCSSFAKLLDVHEV